MCSLAPKRLKPKKLSLKIALKMFKRVEKVRGTFAIAGGSRTKESAYSFGPEIAFCPLVLRVLITRSCLFTRHTRIIGVSEANSDDNGFPPQMLPCVFPYKFFISNDNDFNSNFKSILPSSTWNSAAKSMPSRQRASARSWQRSRRAPLSMPVLVNRRQRRLPYNASVQI